MRQTGSRFADFSERVFFTHLLITVENDLKLIKQTHLTHVTVKCLRPGICRNEQYIVRCKMYNHDFIIMSLGPRQELFTINVLIEMAQ